MADRRLSKLQKWILENCFRVTILLDRTALRPLQNCRDSIKCDSCDMRSAASLQRGMYNNITAYCAEPGLPCRRCLFYREDVLLNYFGLVPDNSKRSFIRVQHFHDGPDYSAAHVTLSRSLKNLKEKGLIYLWRVEDESQRIFLTDHGVSQAAELTETVDYYVPELLSDSEREAVKQRLEQEYRNSIALLNP